MNQPYYLIPSLSPYADNPQFLKKVFRSRLTAAEVVLLAALMAGQLYQALCNTFFRQDLDLISNRIEKELNAFVNVILLLDGLSVLAVLMLPFIGLILMYHRSKHPESVFPKAAVTLCTVFFVILTVICGLDALGSFTDMVEPMLSDLLEGKEEWSAGGLQLLFAVLSAVSGLAYAVWGLGGFLVCSSLKKNLSCQSITASGSGLFIWGGRILCPVVLIPEIFFCIYYRFSPTSEVFTEFSLGKEYAFFASTSPLAEGMYLLSFVLLTAAIVVAVRLCKRYRNASDNAMISIRMKGVNEYTANGSVAGQYYQSFYTAPGAPMPPQAGYAPCPPAPAAPMPPFQPAAPVTVPLAKPYAPAPTPETPVAEEPASVPELPAAEEPAPAPELLAAEEPAPAAPMPPFQPAAPVTVPLAKPYAPAPTPETPAAEEPAPVQPHCPTCGALIGFPGSRFCAECGSSLDP